MRITAKREEGQGNELREGPGIYWGQGGERTGRGKAGTPLPRSALPGPFRCKIPKGRQVLRHSPPLRLELHVLLSPLALKREIQELILARLIGNRKNLSSTEIGPNMGQMSFFDRNESLSWKCLCRCLKEPRDCGLGMIMTKAQGFSVSPMLFFF